MVHLSYGMNKPASPNLLSETEIVARMAEATLGSEKVDWRWYMQDNARIRGAIERVIDGFHDFNVRVAKTRRLPSRRRFTRPGLEDRERQGAVHPACGRYRYAFASRAQEARPAPDDLDDDALARPVQHDDLRPGRPLSRRLRSAPAWSSSIATISRCSASRTATGSTWKASGKTASNAAPRASCWSNTTSRAAVSARITPETNPLVPLHSFALGAGTPASKSIPVLLTLARPRCRKRRADEASCGDHRCPPRRRPPSRGRAAPPLFHASSAGDSQGRIVADMLSIMARPPTFVLPQSCRRRRNIAEWRTMSNALPTFPVTIEPAAGSSRPMRTSP